MSYIVPFELPKYCNKCPFEVPNYIIFFGEGCISSVDGEINKKDTYGSCCKMDLKENQKYTKVIRGNIGGNIKRPYWCKLREIEE